MRISDWSSYVCSSDLYHALDAGSICTSGGKQLGLQFDLVFVSRLLHVVYHAVIADHRGLHDLDGGAFAKFSYLLMVFRARNSSEVRGVGNECVSTCSSRCSRSP